MSSEETSFDPDEVNKVKNAIIEFLKGHSGASFYELDQVISQLDFVKPVSEGYYDITTAAYENLLFWRTKYAIFPIAYFELYKEGKLSVEPCEPLVYAMDGMVMSLPVAAKIKSYETLHWVPLTVNLKNDN